MRAACGASARRRRSCSPSADGEEREHTDDKKQNRDDRGTRDEVPSTLPLARLFDEYLYVWQLRLVAGRCGPHVATARFMGTTIASTMIPVKIDRADPTLLHDQVAADIRRAIADGEANPGEKLPPARDLAAVLGVNNNTVLRALRILREEGLLEFQRGRGITVAGGARQKSIVIAKAKDLVETARRQGYRRDELLRLIEALP